MQALEGIQVIDLTRVIAGPYCTFQLALMGAACIKIEEPGQGDPVRWSAFGSNTHFRDRGMATNYLPQNANKRSLTLDLRHAEGRDILSELIRRSDVLVENFRPGVMKGFGLDYAGAKVINPRLIYCSLTGYGQLPPKATHTAYDGVIQAASGMMSTIGTPETGPLKVGPPITDYATGMAAAYGIALALLQRHRDGTGQYIDVSMLDTALTMMSSNVVDYLCTGNVPRGKGNAPASGSPSAGTFNTREGKLTINANEDHQCRRMCTALGLGHLLSDPRFAELEARRRHGSELKREVEQVLLTRTAQEWEDILNAAGVPAARVRTVAEIMQHPQVTERGLLHTFPDVKGADHDVTLMLAPFQFAHDGPKATTPPPTVGAHTDEVLGELGYDDAAIKRLRDKGVI